MADEGVWFQGQHFLDQPRHVQRVIIHERMRDFPLACMAIAAQRIQALVRGVLTRYRLGVSTRSAVTKRRDKREGNADVAHALKHKYLLKTGVTSLSGYPAWTATRIQSWWRMIRSNRQRALFQLPMYQIAAAEIQYYWRLYLGDKLVRQLQPQTAEEAALRLQRAWRSYTDRQIYSYFKDLVKFRDRGDPMSILRCINPREAALLDVGSGAHVRFRLGGESFPPAIFYKVFIHGALIDMCAFSPKDYFNEVPLAPKDIHNKEGRSGDPDKSQWYQRIENNGWRSVSTAILESAQATEGGIVSEPKVVPWHYDKNVRRQDQKVVKKKRRVKWLRKLYATGIANDRLQSAVVEYNREYADDLAEQTASHNARHEMWEDDDADQLLEWTANLDYNAYHDEWLALGTTNRLDLVGQATVRVDPGDSQPPTTRTTSTFNLGSYPSDFDGDPDLDDDAVEGLVMLDDDPDDDGTFEEDFKVQYEKQREEDLRRTITSV